MTRQKAGLDRRWQGLWQGDEKSCRLRRKPRCGPDVVLRLGNFSKVAWPHAVPDIALMVQLNETRKLATSQRLIEPAMSPHLTPPITQIKTAIALPVRPPGPQPTSVFIPRVYTSRKAL
ncbi:hypothetical protein CQ020_03680 [Arthrobacter sp. MYb23]|nr:hypothetical protein CQ038_03535 [Arthrobacter sp. MYb51]PRB98573.1 hypothetical protein CQ020_03680 [Arthrobacter sp. MYb23]